LLAFRRCGAAFRLLLAAFAANLTNVFSETLSSLACRMP